MEISVVNDHVTQWGEGSIWHNGRLYYVDIEGKSVLSCLEDGGDLRRMELERQPATIVPVSGGGFLIAGEGGIYRWDGKGTPGFLINPEADRPDQRMNDGKCSPDGFFFVGSLNPQREPQAALYRFDRDGKVEKILEGISNSNGLAWSPSGEYMYYIDTPTRQVSRFNYAGGELSNRVELFSTAAYEASPDGMSVDEEGCLWIAMCHAGCVVRFSPEGEVLRQIDLPCREVTSCAFGGENLDQLYVTTGVPGRDRERMAGRLFVVRQLGVKGLISNEFQS